MRAAVALMLLAGTLAAGELTLSFPGRDGPARLQLDVTVDGQSPEVAWVKFLDQLFDHFDRDGDGTLSAAEAGRVFPLPLAKGREAKMDFARLDADRDGRGSRAEFRAFYRAAGFMPVVVGVRPASADVFALGEAAFRRLDRDGDGQLSAAELRNAPALLKRFDEDEDEILTAAELLAGFMTSAKPVAEVEVVEAATPHARLSLPLDGTPTLTASPSFTLSRAAAAVLTTPSGRCTISREANGGAAGFRAARGFYLAQFQDAGDGPVAKKVFEADPTTAVLAGLFDAADRDGDGKLTRAELDGFFALIEAGVSCRVVVTVDDRGRNLFDLIDADGNGRLDARELRLAEKLPAAKDRRSIPASYRLTVGRGPVGTAFGPFPLGSVATPKVPAKPVAGGPRWFQAMDRNRDGFVSAAEFLGPPARFRTLDADGDGRISVAEAAANGTDR